MGGRTRVESALPGMPPQAWHSRAEMMRARAQAIDELEKTASHDWRRILAGAVSLVLVIGAELFLFVVVGAAVDGQWDPVEVLLLVALAIVAVVALAGGSLLGVRTWRRGRRVISALVAWEELTDRVAPDGSYVSFNFREVEDADSDDERRHIWWRNWVWFRTRQITFARAGRMLTGTFVFLGGGAVAGGTVGLAFERGQLVFGDLITAILGLTVLLYGCVVLGGQGRFAVTMGKREFRMRRRNRRVRREQRERREAWERKAAGE